MTALNVSPTQMQPKCWGSIRSIEIVCGALGIELVLGVFFTFYKAKGRENFLEMLYNNDGSYRFLICWISDPVPIRGFNPNKLSAKNRCSGDL